MQKRGQIQFRGMSPLFLRRQDAGSRKPKRPQSRDVLDGIDTAFPQFCPTCESKIIEECASWLYCSEKLPSRLRYAHLSIAN